MLDFSIDAEHSIVHLRPKAALRKEDFEMLTKAVDPHIEGKGGLAGLIVEVDAFPGWESLGAMAAHFRFVRDHHKKVKKIAVVTDAKMGEVAEKLASHFVSAEIKHFPAGQAKAAQEWIARGVIRPRNLELHVTHGCNFTCEGCSHYSNQHHKGMLSLEDGERWMAPWSGRLAPSIFSLLGGEPALNPRLAEFVPLAGRHFPRAELRLVTNGVLLHRHPDLPRALSAHPNARLYLSIHHDAPEYVEKMKPVLALLGSWQKQHGVKVSLYESYKHWTRRYHGFGAAMQPFEDARPRESWENCTARYCPQLFEGKIWKCGPLAYLGMQHAKYGLADKWQPYLGYRPLEAGCSEEELREFFAREEESHCAMCPAQPGKFKLPVPMPMRRAAVAPPAQ